MTVEEAIQGAKDIIAENISDNANYRKQIKRMCYKDGIITVKGATDENLHMKCTIILMKGK